MDNNKVRTVSEYLKRIEESLKVLDEKKVALKNLEEEINEIRTNEKVEIDELGQKFFDRDKLKKEIELLKEPSFEYNALSKIYNEKFDRLNELRAKVSPNTNDKLYGNNAFAKLYKTSTEEQKIEAKLLKSHYAKEIEFIENSMNDIIEPPEQLEQKTKNAIEGKEQQKEPETKQEEPKEFDSLAIGDAKTLIEIEKKIKEGKITDEEKEEFKKFIEECLKKTGIKTPEELFVKANEMVKVKEQESDDNVYPDLSKDSEKAANFLNKQEPSELNNEEKEYVVGKLGLENNKEITLDDLNNAKAALIQDLSKDNGKSKVSKIAGASKGLAEKAKAKLQGKGKGKIVAAVVLAGVAITALATGGASLFAGGISSLSALGTGAIGLKAYQDFQKGKKL